MASRAGGPYGGRGECGGRDEFLWPDFFLAAEGDGGDRRGFAGDGAGWRLPLSRTAAFESASHFPDADPVADCALTFRNATCP
jgi:hypothetical protein